MEEVVSEVQRLNATPRYFWGNDNGGDDRTWLKDNHATATRIVTPRANQWQSRALGLPFAGAERGHTPSTRFAFASRDLVEPRRNRPVRRTENNRVGPSFSPSCGIARSSLCPARRLGPEAKFVRLPSNEPRVRSATPHHRGQGYLRTHRWSHKRPASSPEKTLHVLGHSK
jgi:hypothetical protein